MAVAVTRHNREVLYVAITSENKVISIEILESQKGKKVSPNGNAMVRVMASNATPKNLGHAPTTGVINSPDNLALDSQGNLYVIEDAPNGNAGGGDIWFIRDRDNNAVAESVDHFMTIQVAGSEATGMVFNPANPLEFVVCVQHPASTNLDNVPAGLGDAVWKFNLANVPNKSFVKSLVNKPNTFTNQ
jgi:uncharacterized protein